MRTASCLLFLIVSLYAATAYGQHEKVGLVLSGGGAKGLAHIGVLKALEENNIPIDYITGTSMGGVVGGFYAAGYSPQEIEEIATSKDFINWINGITPERYQYFYLSRPSTPKWLGINLGVDSNLEANFNPKLANDLSLNFELAEHMAPSQPIAEASFDQLFVPFKAMGAEVFTQQEVLLDHGNLGTALRATMSVPFVYRPVKIDGQYIFDGGVYNNFPVEPMKAYYQPDVMIGVNVASRVYDEYPEAKAEQMISSSLLFMMMDKADPKKLGTNGLFITPNMKNASGFDFSNPQAIIDSGYTEALRMMPQIKENIKRRVSLDSLATARTNFKQQQRPLNFSHIMLTGFTENQKAFIKKTMFKNQNGQRSIDEIKANYYKLAAEPYFSDIFPTIGYDPKNSSYSLQLSAQKEQKIGLQIGGNIASNNLSNVYLGASLDMLNRYLFNHYLTGQIGSFYKAFEYDMRINFAFRHPMYIAPVYAYQQHDYDNVNGFIIKRTNQNVKTDRQVYGLQVGMPIFLKSKLRIHLMGFENHDSFGENSAFQFSDSLYKYEYRGAFVSTDIGYESLNKKIFATEGQQFQLGITYQYGLQGEGEESTASVKQAFLLKGNYQAYYPLNFGTFGFNITGQLSTMAAFSNYAATILNTPSYEPTFESRSRFLPSYRAPIFMGFGLKYQFPLFKHTALRSELHAFKPFVLWKEVGNEISWGNLTPAYKLSAMVAFIYNTPIGPISLSTHYYDTPYPVSIFLNIGYLMFKESRLN